MDATTTGPPSVAELLKHTEWVRGLAYQLVEDAALADDIVQQAWVCALESPPRHASNLKAWLASVVTRLAQTEWRSSKRRAMRERQGARSEAQPPTDQLVHEAQRSSDLTDAVVALEEPYRTVVLLRYFRDQKPAQIARALERPAATIKTQLQRGLEQLRGELDRRYGDRRSWCLALLPLARGGAPAGGFVALGTGAWIGLLGLVAASIWVTGSWSEAPDRGLVGKEVEGVSPLVAEQPREEQQAASADDDEPGRIEERFGVVLGQDSPSPPPTAPETYTLSGRVVDIEGHSRAGVRVRWIDPGALRWLDESRSVIVGRNTWIPVSPKEHERLGDDEAALAAFAAENFDRPDRAVALLRDEVPTDYQATTDGGGWFTMELPDRGYSLELVDSREDVIGHGEVNQPGGEAIRVWIVGPRRTFRGRVVDSSGEPVEGADLLARTSNTSLLAGVVGLSSSLQDRRYHSSSDAAGEFVFENVSIGPSVSLTGTKLGSESGFVIVELPENVAHEPEPTTVTLFPDREHSPQLVLHGRVLLDDGSLAPRATVVLGGIATTTDGDGAYRLVLHRPWGDLCAGRAGSGIAVVPGLGDELREATGEINVVDIFLPRTSLSIEGQVRDESGVGLAGVVISLQSGIHIEGKARYLETIASGRQVETDAEGRFRLDGLADREYQLSARPGAGLGSSSEAIRAGERHAVIVLSR